MTTNAHKTLVHALLRILRRLIRVLLRNGITYSEFSEYARRVYVQTAWEDFPIEGRKPTVSRVAMVVDLSRKEVKRLLESPLEISLDEEQRYNRAARVLTGWLRDPDYCDAFGKPRALSLEDPENGFPALVRRHSGDIPARAILDELVRVGSVHIDDDHAILIQRGYTPRGDDAQMLHIFGTDVSDLIETIDHNLLHQDMTFFQQKVSYDNVPLELVEKWRALAAEQSQGFLESLDGRLSRLDRDANPRIKGHGRVRTGVGIFYFEETLDNSLDEENKS